jgi:hypothetical protein
MKAFNQDRPSSKQKSLFYYILPGEIYFNPELAPLDKDVYWAISLYDKTELGCWAQGYPAMVKLLSYREKRNIKAVKSSAAKLERKGLIERIRISGKAVHLRTTGPKGLQRYKRYVDEFNERGRSWRERREQEFEAGKGHDKEGQWHDRDGQGA